jgi:two-component system invasion response regulator UvrY
MRILIADDHAVVRRGLRDILREEFPFAEIEEVGDSEDLIKKVMKSEWSVILTDVSMPGRNGLEALAQIKQLQPKVPVLILSVYPEEQYAVRALKAGAAGYLNKDMAPDELVNAVQRVLSGNKYITASIAEKLLSAFDYTADKLLHEYLSNREFEVFKLIAAGKSVSDIAEMFHLSVTTISTFRARIMAKMNMKTNADLTQYALAHKLI